MTQNTFEKWIHPLYGHPCWGLEYGRQTNLSLNFGKPSLEVREPMSSESKSEVVQDLASRRLVTVRGQWWLWLQCCYWQLKRDEVVLATGSSSLRKIEKGMAQLSGQKLISFSINERTGYTSFDFDLGCQLNC